MVVLDIERLIGIGYLKDFVLRRDAEASRTIQERGPVREERRDERPRRVEKNLPPPPYRNKRKRSEDRDDYENASRNGRVNFIAGGPVGGV